MPILMSPEMSPLPLYIDASTLDPAGQEAALRAIVDILRSTPNLSPELPRPADPVARGRVLAGVESYRAAVVALVIAGDLNHGQGQTLNDIVDKIVAEETSAP
jgi:hypothetical protein